MSLLRHYGSMHHIKTGTVTGSIGTDVLVRPFLTASGSNASRLGVMGVAV